MSISQRITVTQKGRELQEQLKDVVKSTPKIQLKQDNQNKHPFDDEMNAQDQLDGYADLIQHRLKTPQQYIDFLENKFQKQPLFVQKEMEKIGYKIYQYGNHHVKSQAILPQLDFRQQQYMKSKYDHFIGNTSQRSSIHKLEDGIQKRVNYMLFQEGKIERMITKYEKFNEKAKSIPQYKKNEYKDENFVKNILKKMEIGQETRVESIQEINQLHKNELALMDYNNAQKDRLRQTMSELHKSRYEKKWNRLKLPKT